MPLRSCEPGGRAGQYLLRTMLRTVDSLLAVAKTCVVTTVTISDGSLRSFKVKRAVNGPQLFACWKRCEEVLLYRREQTHITAKEEVQLGRDSCMP